MKQMGRYGAAAAAVLVAASLVGCNGEDPEPKISPSAAPSSSATPSPTSASATPEAETPEAFIRRWAQLETEMQNTGETSGYRRIAADCAPCNRTADLVDQFYSNGGFIRTDGRTVEALDPLGANRGTTTYRVRMRSAPTEYKESADGPLKTFPGGLSNYRVELKREDGGWQLLDYVELAQ